MLEEDDVTGAGVPCDEQVTVAGEFNRDVTWRMAWGVQDLHSRYDLLTRFHECQPVLDREQVPLRATREVVQDGRNVRLEGLVGPEAPFCLADEILRVGVQNLAAGGGRRARVIGMGMGENDLRYVLRFDTEGLEVGGQFPGACLEVRS